MNRRRDSGCPQPFRPVTADAPPPTTGGIRVRHFNPKMIAPTSTIVVIGKRRTGKSVLVKDFMFHLRRSFEFVVGFIGTADTRKEYATAFGARVTLHNNYKPEILKSMTEIGELFLDLGRPMHPAVVIIDDCSYKKGLFRDESLCELAKNGRHYELGTIIATQYCMDLGPDWRNQVDFLVILRNGIPEERKKLHKYFFGGTYSQFNKMMDACTKDFMGLVLDNRTPETSIEDRVYWYKARPDLPKFDVRSRDFRYFERMYALPQEVVARKRIEALIARRASKPTGATKQRAPKRKRVEELDETVTRLPPARAKAR